MKISLSFGESWVVGLLTAVVALLCCITPVLALWAGSAGIASTFSWLEPVRPYLGGITLAALGIAWYQTLNPVTSLYNSIAVKHPFTRWILQ